MATNFFFRGNYASRNDQKLLDNLTVEAIKIYGQDVYYVPRNLGNYDVVYGSDDQSVYGWAIPIEMYMVSFDGFGGDREFFSKFQVEIRNTTTWSVAMTRFSEECRTSILLNRPREGDLVYFPMNDRCYQIKKVDKYEHFYQVGSLQTWQLECENFEYSDESFQTGVPDIDKLQVHFTTNVLDDALLTEDGYPLRTERGDYVVLEDWQAETLEPEQEEFADDSSQIIAFDVTNPFADITDTRTGT